MDSRLDDLFALARDPATAWMGQGLCAQVDPDLWFPTEDSTDRAGASPPRFRRPKAICGSCPVKADCLEWGLANDDEVGIWGGTTTAERDEMRVARTGIAA